MSAEILLADALPGLQLFSYPAVAAPQLPALDGLPLAEWECAGSGVVCHSKAASDESSGTPAIPDQSAFEQQLAEKCSRSYEEGREKGMEEGRTAERERAACARNREATDLKTGLLENFAGEQARYFELVESQVIRLALALAGRILRREAKMDPLLLTGTVRAALGQIAASSRVRLLVPSAELELWTEAMALLPNLPTKPAVAAGEGMQLGDCLLESDLGSADLGISSQLAEIERTFFDNCNATSENCNEQMGGKSLGDDL